MSALDRFEQIGVITPRLRQDAARNVLAYIVWRLFDDIKDRSLKFKIGPVPISIKAAKCEFLIELMVGPRGSTNGLSQGT